MNYKPSALLAFLNTIKSFVACEEGKVMDGCLGQSLTYETSEVFKRIFGTIDWIGKTEKQKANIIELLSTKHPIYSTPVSSSVVDFDLKPEKCNINVNANIFRMVYDKAERLITDNAIMVAPAASNTAAYTSLSTAARGHYNTIISLGTYEIKCNCMMHKTHHICSHAVAAAHIQGVLYSFIRFHRKKYKQNTVKLGSFTRCVNTERAGMKDNQRKRSRTMNATNSGDYAPSVKRNTCDHDVENMIRLCSLEDHSRVRRCYTCKQSIFMDNFDRVALSNKDFSNLL